MAPSVEGPSLGWGVWGTVAGRAGLTNVEIAFITLAADSHATAAQEAPEPLEMLLADDAAQVRGALGVVAIETGDGALQGGHQPRLHLGAAQDVVGGHAGLAGIETAEEGHPVGHGLGVAVVVHVAGVLASQLQCDGRQVLGGGSHDNLANLRVPWARK